MNLLERAKEKVIIAAHRGECGGNIPCNTIAAYDCAINNGADMIEIDANISADGTLYSFHPKMEGRHLNAPELCINDLTDAQIRELRYVNYDRAATEWGLCTLDEIFERYKGRCFINVDKFSTYPREISDCIRRHNILDQIVVKTGPKPEMFDIIEGYAPEIQFLPIIKEDNGIHDMLMHRNINYVGAEVVFTDETTGVGSAEFIEKLHKDGKLVWANAIIYNYKKQLAAGHSDDYSIACDPEGGWGWLADRGYDIIQTDWPAILYNYREQK